MGLETVQDSRSTRGEYVAGVNGVQRRNWWKGLKGERQTTNGKHGDYG